MKLLISVNWELTKKTRSGIVSSSGLLTRNSPRNYSLGLHRHWPKQFKQMPNGVCEECLSWAVTVSFSDNIIKQTKYWLSALQGLPEEQETQQTLKFQTWTWDQQTKTAKGKCTQCGYVHCSMRVDACPALRQTCKKCQGKDHFASECFSNHIHTKEVVIDNGPQFCKVDFKEFTSTCNFIHVTFSPHFPSDNGEAEWAVHTAKRILVRETHPWVCCQIG